MGSKSTSHGNGDDRFDPSVSSKHDGLPKIDLLWSHPANVDARVSRVRIARLTLAEIREDVPLLALLSFPADRLFVSFPIGGTGLQQWDGVAMESGALLLHASDSRIHWRSLGWNRVGFVSFTPADCDEWSQILFHHKIPTAKTRFILAPEREEMERFLQLHADAIRLAADEENVLSHAEVIRSLEDELIVALMMCLLAPDADQRGRERAECARSLGEVEDAVLRNPQREWARDELCAIAGVSTRTLGACCNELVQMPASRYVRLLKEFGSAEANGGSFENVQRMSGQFGDASQTSKALESRERRERNAGPRQLDVSQRQARVRGPRRDRKAK
jgi:hypothetical protein